MKIYIVGSVASGKTTMGKKLHAKYGIKCTHLDGVIHVKDETNKEWGNRRRSDEEIENIFEKVINSQDWIIEDAGRKIFSKGMDKADIIIYLKPSLIIRKRRIVTRYIKQKLGMEACLYRPSLKMVKFMFKALKNYESGVDDLEERLRLFEDKKLTIKTKKDLERIYITIDKTLK